MFTNLDVGDWQILWLVSENNAREKALPLCNLFSSVHSKKHAVSPPYLCLFYTYIVDRFLGCQRCEDVVGDSIGTVQSVADAVAAGGEAIVVSEPARRRGRHVIVAYS